MDIGGWLRSLGLERYEAVFRENEIDDTVLPTVTAEDLKDLGVDVVGHRRKLLNATSALRADVSDEGPTAEAPSATPKPIHDTAERRQVTVMFSDLVGSTALSARMDPEDLREVISSYQKCVAETVQRFGGFVAKYLGDGDRRTRTTQRCIAICMRGCRTAPEWPISSAASSAPRNEARQSPAGTRSTNAGSELAALRKLQKKIELFAEGAGIRADASVDVVGRMADALKVTQGSGTRSGGNYSGQYAITYLKPRAELHAAAWQIFDRLLRPAGYEWTKTFLGGKKGGDRKWEKWTPAP